jgi:glycosyltransferase involved in cell wall biosynthesis
MQDRSSDTDTPEAPRRRRVLIVTDSLENGGMERQLTLLAKALPATWAVRVVSLWDGVYASVLREARVEVSILPREFRFDIRPAVPLSKIIRDWRPTVVHTYGWMSMAASVLPCRFAGIPIVDASIRVGAVLTRRDRLMRAMTSRADVVIANSQAGLDAYGVDPRRGRVVHNGFDPERWRLCLAGRRAEWPTTVVMTGRMHRHKDYRCLLDAARVLCAEDPEGWRFLAVGSGEERPALLSEYRDLLESGAVVFPEAGDEVLSLVCVAHIGVLLTNAAFAAEGLSNSIMEYMACGLPVVCTDSGGNRELVVEGETGLLVPSGDVDAVVRRLRSLRDGPATASRMGRAGRERIATVFTVDALVRGTIGAYDLAAEGRRTAATTGSP